MLTVGKLTSEPKIEVGRIEIQSKFSAIAKVVTMLVCDVENETKIGLTRVGKPA